MSDQEKQENAIEREKEKARKENLIRFSVEKTESVDSVMPIRWCIDPSVFEDLKERGIENPCLLLVVVICYNGRNQEVIRKVIPLDQEMEYLQFKRPGLHKIMAIVVWNYNGNVNKLKEMLLRSRYRGTYEVNVLTYDKDRLEAMSGSIKAIHGGGSIEVNVAEGFFAKKPPKWLSWWVNLWFTYPPIDQCDFKKRFLIGFPKFIIVAPWLFGKELIAIIISLFFLACGMRKIDFSPLRRPFSHELWLIGNYLDGSIFLNRKYPFLILFAPIFFLPLLGGFAITGLFLETKSSTRMTGYGLTTIFSFLLLFLLAQSLIFLSLRLFGLLRKIKIPKLPKLPGLPKLPKLPRVITERLSEIRLKMRVEQQKQQVEKLKVRELLKQKEKIRKYKHISTIVCISERLEPSLNALPKEKRTIHLRFLDLKKKFCKPYAE